MPTARSGPEATRPRAATILEVGRAAGVAPSTVSRSFTNPDRVNVVTREHVLAVAERLGYRPPRDGGRPTTQRRSATVALVLPDIANPYFSGFIRGAEREAAAAAYTLVVADSQESPHAEERIVSKLTTTTDGLLLVSSRLPDRAVAAAARQTPVVLLGRQVRGVASVCPDQASGTRQIVDHLASYGHREIAFCAGPPTSWLGGQRWLGIRSAAKALGISARRIGPFPPSVEGGLVAADAAMVDGATAIVAHNDLMALGILRRLAQRGVPVPEAVSVVGFDDIFGADFCQPSLTTLGHRTEHAGRSAVDLLTSLIGDDLAPVSEIVVPTQLVMRDSTGPAAGPRS